MIILLVVAAFVCILAYPAIEYSIDEAIVRTPGLGISNSWRASAVAVGTVLIAVFSLLRLLVDHAEPAHSWRRPSSCLSLPARRCGGRARSSWGSATTIC